MHKKTSAAHRLLALLLAMLLALSLLPLTALAGQEDGYHDPAEHWLSASNRTNELDVNAVVTHETAHCFLCGMDSAITVWRTPEYSRDGQSALVRNIGFSDGTLLDGSGTGTILDGKPGVNATYTGYHWTKSMCEACGGLNTNGGNESYAFCKNIYLLYDCAPAFTEELDAVVTYERVDANYHRKLTDGGSCCAFCYGTRHSHAESLERHTLHTDVFPELDRQRFAVVTHCAQCDYADREYLAAKAVVADYFGTVDGQAHSISVTDLSESGVSVQVRYGNSADACTLRVPPAYSEAGQYSVYYQITYSCQGVSMEENGVAWVWLRSDAPELAGCVCGCGEVGCACGNGCDCPHCRQFDCAHGVHDFRFIETAAPTCTAPGYDRWYCPLCGQWENRNYVSAEGHVWKSVVIREADCAHGGKILEICQTCGETRETTTEQTRHQWKRSTVAATCTGPGYTVEECPVCGERRITDLTEAAGHSYRSQVIPATCTTGGMTLHVCQRCGESYTDSPTEATGHRWNSGEILIAPSCVSAGVREYVCEACGVSRNEAIPAKAHKPGPAATCTEAQLCADCGAVLAQPTGHVYMSSVTPPYCERMGYTTYTCAHCGETHKGDYTDALGHDYKAVVTAPSCTDKGCTTYTCTRCGDSYVDNYTDALGHDWDNGTKITDATCNGAGVIEHHCKRCTASYLEAIDATGHKPGPAATCTEAQVCTVCGVILAPARGHSFTASVTEPGCKTMGFTTYVCDDCGESYRADYLLPLGHAYHAAVTAPTCTEAGYTTYTCTRCGDSYVSDRVPAAGHSYDGGTILIRPGCTTEGIRLYTCEACGWEHSKSIPATGHKPGTVASCTEPQVCADCGVILCAAHGHIFHTEHTEASCETMGYTTCTCESCGLHSRANYTDALGHSYATVVTAPTCTEPGYTTHVCARCGDSYVTDYTEATGHRWDRGTLLIATSCNGEGLVDHRCVVCDYHHLEPLSSKGHRPGAAASCTEPQVCTDCGAVLVQALGHDFSASVTAPTCTEMGYTTYSCVHCDTQYRDQYTAPTGHSVGDWIVDREADTEAEGQRHRECAVCGLVLTTEVLEKLYVMATTDSRGVAVVGVYLVTVTDTDTGNPVANATVVLGNDGAISVRLPDGRLLDYAARTTVTVLLAVDRTPVQELSVLVTDGNGNYAAAQTDEAGQLTVPGDAGVTGPDGRITVGWIDADGNRYTLTLEITDDENGRPIRGVSVTVGKTGNILVLLPDGIDMDEANRILLLLTDNRKALLPGWVILVKGDRNQGTGTTDRNGRLVLPERAGTETHGAYIVGYPDGSFGPERSMTRAEATAIFARLLAEKQGDVLIPVEVTGFADIPANAWYSGYVRYLSGRDVVYGKADGRFFPDDAITRAEFVALAVRFFAVYGDGNPAIMEQYAAFPDVSEGHWAAEYIRDAAVYGWIRGYGDGSFRAEQRITRAEVVTIVNRLLDRTADTEYVTRNLFRLTTFTDMSEAHWAYYAVMEAANAHSAVYDGKETWNK